MICLELKHINPVFEIITYYLIKLSMKSCSTETYLPLFNTLFFQSTVKHYFEITNIRFHSFLEFMLGNANVRNADFTHSVST